MILCTNCSEGRFSTNQKEKTLICTKCGFKIPIQDNLIIFHPEESDTHKGIEPCLYDGVIDIEERHFWMDARRKLIKSTFERYVKCTDKIIEIGAGTGNTAGYLMKNGFENISVGEVHLRGLEYAKRYGIKERYQLDVTRTPFREHFDVVGIFDVLEHTDDDQLVVENVYKMLKKDGKVVVTVPAHMWLWSKEDVIPYHRRRYELKQIRELFERSGFRILKASAFFIFILPLLYLRRLVNKDNGVIKEEDLKDRFYINPILNFILGKILNLEIKLLSNVTLKYGGSIILVGEK